MITVYIKTFTAAKRGLKFLQKNGIRCTMERSFGREGCGFALKISDQKTNKAEVCALLSSVGVSCDLSR